MKIKLYQVDAFASRVFSGNPAAVCPLQSWLSDALMQAIAAENNLSETAFFVPSQTGFQLRWFTPVREVDLCGHATLAAAHVIFEALRYAGSTIIFETRSGELRVHKHGPELTMDFPASPPAPCAIPEIIGRALGRQPREVLVAEDYLAVFDTQAEVLAIAPDFALLSRLDLRGVIVTARGDEVDFVSRFFAPKYGINEDPVTGSAHCILTPYWAQRLGRNSMRARQISQRGGDIDCELKNGRVLLSGVAVTFMEGEIRLAAPE